MTGQRPQTMTHTRDDVVRLYTQDLRGKLRSGKLDIRELRAAKRLGCWCAPKPCHGHILAQLAAANDSELALFIESGTLPSS